MGCEFSDRIRNFKRQIIKELFVQLNNQDQQAFTRLHGDIFKIPEGETYHIYYQCKRTLRKYKNRDNRLPDHNDKKML